MTTSNLQETVTSLLAFACDFQGNSMQARESARIEYRKAEPEKENSLRIIIDGLTAKLAENMAHKIENTNEKISYQVALATSFIRTYFLISDLTLNGDLLEATVLLRIDARIN